MIKWFFAPPAVGITPFNFPAMVPLWMYPLAIACGNTFVLKPSEKVPLTAVRLGELLMEAGLPEGVFNIVHGDKECVDALITHPQVRAISFVGSTKIAKYIYETGTQHDKRVQAAGGAKNHLIIMPDADLDQSVAALAASGYGCAGERCMAGSLALPVGDIGDRLVDSLCAKASGMKVGPTSDGEGADMGPLITRAHLERVTGYLDIGVQEGASLPLDGRKVDYKGEGFIIGPSVLDNVQPGMRVAKEEIFGPVLSVIRAEDLDQALAIGRDCEYGNGASIFTRSGWAARQFKRHFNAGMIGINIGVPAPMAWFPFTGWNKSFFGDLHSRLDGRKVDYKGEGFIIGPSVLDNVQPGMRVAKEEIFGPVLSVIRAEDLDQALAIGRDCEYGNGASIFTRSGWAARQFKRHFNAGMIGINIGVPAPMAWFPFTGWNKSFYGDLHIQGTEGIQFYTQQKMTMTRWFESPDESHHDPVWKSK